MRVRIPSPLHSYTKNKAQVEASGASLDLLINDLERQFRGIRFRFIDEQDRIRPHIKIFRNGEQVWELSTPLSDKDEIAIVQAFSGG